VIVADKNAKAGLVASVMDEILKVGIKDVSVGAMPSGGS
jgi:biopolymer transport protein ExbD